MRNCFIAFVAALTLFSACKKEDNPDPQKQQLPVGVFIVNQGAFNADNASLSYFEPIGNNTDDSLFFEVNGATLGDVAQSINVRDELSYIVINNSGLIYCIDNKYAEVQGKITGLTSPRNILFINNQKAYVSDLYNSNITIVNPSTYEITGEIPVGRTSEEMVLIGKTAYVANYSAFSQTKKNDVVLVIDTDTDTMTDTLKVGVEPNSIVTDMNNNVWVLCSGGWDNQEHPTIWKINGANGEVLHTYTFNVLESSPSALKINGNGDQLYFLNNGVFSMSINDEQLPSTPMIYQVEGQFFGYLGVDPTNSDIYIGNPKDYQSFGLVYRFDAAGNYIGEIDAGIIPGAFGFNY